jgi:FtsZ-binding cell division protein ZapB
VLLHADSDATVSLPSKGLQELKEMKDTIVCLQQKADGLTQENVLLQQDNASLQQDNAELRSAVQVGCKQSCCCRSFWKAAAAAAFGKPQALRCLGPRYITAVLL